MVAEALKASRLYTDIKQTCYCKYCRTAPQGKSYANCNVGNYKNAWFLPVSWSVVYPIISQPTQLQLRPTVFRSGVSYKVNLAFICEWYDRNLKQPGNKVLAD